MFQLEDGNSLFDYDVGLNDIIQLMVRPLPTHSVSPQPTKPTTTNGHTCSPTQNGSGALQNGNGTVQNGNGTVENGGEDEEMAVEEEIGVYRVSELTLANHTTLWCRPYTVNPLSNLGPMKYDHPTLPHPAL